MLTALPVSLQTEFRLGVRFYSEEQPAAAVLHLEKALEEYFVADTECRALCEGPYDYEGYNYLEYNADLFQAMTGESTCAKGVGTKMPYGCAHLSSRPWQCCLEVSKATGTLGSLSCCRASIPWLGVLICMIIKVPSNSSHSVVPIDFTRRNAAQDPLPISRGMWRTGHLGTGLGG